MGVIFYLQLNEESMGRYRPPPKKSSCYITRQGYEDLNNEHEHLWFERRPEVVKALSAAAAEGDRSENAEYHYRKKELGGIDYRVRYLRKRLTELKIVDSVPDDPKKIYFGAWVELENEQGEILIYRIVGPDEFDKHEAYISMDSPVAKALMGKTEDDDVRVKGPEKDLLYAVLQVSYQPLA